MSKLKKNLKRSKRQPKKLIPFSSLFPEDFNNKNIAPDKDDLYYDAMELLDSGDREAKQALKLLEQALEMDKNYVQTYIGLIYAYSAVGDLQRAEEAVKTAFEKTRKKFPKWPNRLEWGFLENRAYLRAIQSMADLYWDKKEKDKAIELYRLLLKLNPNDNQGIRYEIAALYAGLTGKDVNKMFDEGNRRQNWDKLENLVKIQNSKHKFWRAPRD